jgi:hypothetical protein
MTFMSSLAANPSGGSGIYNSQKPPDQANELAIMNQIKDREMRDFKDKAGFMSDLSVKQNRLMNLYDPASQQSQDQRNQQMQQGPQVSQVRDPNAMTGDQKANNDMRQQGLNLDKQKLDQQKQLGQEAIDTKSAQEKLNQQKSDQIHQQKIDELIAKQTDAKGKLDLATKALSDKTKSADEQLKLHQDIMTNTKAFHDAEVAQMKLKFERAQADHEDALKTMKAKLDAGNKSVTTTLNPDGTSKTVKTTTGDANKTIRVQMKDGTFGTIPVSKLDDFNANYSHPNSPHLPPPALAGPQAGQQSPDDEQENDSSENGR